MLQAQHYGELGKRERGVVRLHGKGNRDKRVTDDAMDPRIPLGNSYFEPALF